MCYNIFKDYVLHCQIKILLHIKRFTLVNLVHIICSLQYGKYIIQALQADQSLVHPHSSLILYILGAVINYATDKRTLLSVGKKPNQTTTEKSPKQAHKKPQQHNAKKALTFLHAKHTILLLKKDNLRTVLAFT